MSIHSINFKKINHYGLEVYSLVYQNESLHGFNTFVFATDSQIYSD